MYFRLGSKILKVKKVEEHGENKGDLNVNDQTMKVDEILQISTNQEATICICYLLKRFANLQMPKTALQYF